MLRANGGLGSILLKTPNCNDPEFSRGCVAIDNSFCESWERLLEGARPHDSAVGAGARGRGDSVMVRSGLFIAFALLAETPRQLDPLTVCF
jgi:hypothetical protein